jgi:membrane protease YdiL (CAAX protease family)
MLNQDAISELLMNLGGGWYFALNGIGTVIVILLTFLLAGWLLDRRKFVDFGFHFSRKWWLDLGFGLGLGAVLMLLIFLIELAAGWITTDGIMQVSSSSSFISAILASLVGFIAVGIYEEMLSRGYHLRNLAEGLNWGKLGARGGLWAGYLISSSVFGLLHATNPNASWISTLNLILAGLFLGLGFVLTGELAIPIGLHITWNFFQGNIFGFPVSGMKSGVSLISIQQGGPDLLTGGAFGPEAGLVGIFAILLGSLITVWYVRTTRGEVRLRTELAVYKKPVKKNELSNSDSGLLTNVMVEDKVSSLSEETNDIPPDSYK